jgi:hypothetical protein
MTGSKLGRVTIRVAKVKRIVSIESPLRQINFITSTESATCEGGRTWNSMPSQYIDTKRCSYTVLCGFKLRFLVSVLVVHRLKAEFDT